MKSLKTTVLERNQAMPALSITNPSLTQPKNDEQLIQACVRCTEQCETLVDLLIDDSSVFSASTPHRSSIGAHMRHILDRFQCFFAGLDSGLIDYDDRNRDPMLERDMVLCRHTIKSIAICIRDLTGKYGGCTGIKVREAVDDRGPSICLDSTIERELMALVTHSTHHLAIIAIIVRSFGYDLARDFGKAPSTIVYENEKRVL